MENNVNTLKQR